ncbi:MAG: metallophosphoesterase [Synergistaceae bacterium]
MKKCTKKLVISVLITATFIFLTNSLCYAGQNANELKENDFFTLRIIQTNDIHGQLYKLPQFATIINYERGRFGNLLLFDCGDIYKRGYLEKHEALPEIEIMGTIKYDAMVLGNNDFKTKNMKEHGDRVLNNIVDKLTNHGIDVLCSNVRYADGDPTTGDQYPYKDSTKKEIRSENAGKLLGGVKPYIIKNVRGLKVGVIGVTGPKPFVRGYELDKDFFSPVKAVKKIAKELKTSGKADIIIVLSHCGIEIDDKISSATYKESKSESEKKLCADAILSADDHYNFQKPIWKSKGDKRSTPIIQNGGEKNATIGYIDLMLQKKNGKFELVNFSGNQFEIDDFTEKDLSVLEIIKKWENK